METSILKLADSGSKKVREYVKEKLKSLDLEFDINTETRHLANQALQESQDSEVISVSPGKTCKAYQIYQKSGSNTGSKTPKKAY